MEKIDLSKLILKANDNFLNSNGFAKMCGISESIAKPIKSLIDRMLINFTVENFTFMRIYKDYSYSIVTLDPVKIYKLVKYGLVPVNNQEPILNYQQIIPIYDRFANYSEKQLKKYLNDPTEKVNSYESLTLEYDLGCCKDVFSFLIKRESKIELSKSYHIMHNIVVYFYQIFPFDFKKRFFYSQCDFKKNYGNEDVCKFSPFEKLTESLGLTKGQAQYCKLIALGLEAKKIALGLNKSIRTVQNNIEKIKRHLLLNSKNELQLFLQVFYLEQVQLYLDNTEKNGVKKLLKGKIINSYLGSE